RAVPDRAVALPVEGRAGAVGRAGQRELDTGVERFQARARGILEAPEVVQDVINVLRIVTDLDRALDMPVAGHEQSHDHGQDEHDDQAYDEFEHTGHARN